jgi:hypothetical protein
MKKSSLLDRIPPEGVKVKINVKLVEKAAKENWDKEVSFWYLLKAVFRNSCANSGDTDHHSGMLTTPLSL